MPIYGALALFFIWLIIITFIVFKTRSHYLNLISKTKKNNIDEILDKLVENDLRFRNDLEDIKKHIKGLHEDSKLHVQKVGLVSFSPFGRGVGEHSFVLSLLNAEKNGIVINFIYTSNGLRVYIKKIKDGQTENSKLSDEEKEAISKAELIN